MIPFKLRAVTPEGVFDVEHLRFLGENGCLVRLKNYPHKSPDAMMTLNVKHLQHLTASVDKNNRGIWEGDKCRCRLEVPSLGTDVDLEGVMAWTPSQNLFSIHFKSEIDFTGMKVKEVEVVDE